MNNIHIQLLSDERLMNFLAGAFLFICLNLFEEQQKKKHYCPLYCETKHKHNLVIAKKND